MTGRVQRRMRGDARDVERLEALPVWEPIALRRRAYRHRDRFAMDRRCDQKRLDVARRRTRRRSRDHRASRLVAQPQSVVRRQWGKP